MIQLAVEHLWRWEGQEDFDFHYNEDLQREVRRLGLTPFFVDLTREQALDAIAYLVEKLRYPVEMTGDTVRLVLFAKEEEEEEEGC